MIDAVKDYLTPKTFGILAYVCSIIHFLCGVVFTSIVIALKVGEAEKFTCYVAPESTLIYKTQVDKACYSRYQQNYSSRLPFYGFVILSIWFPIIVAVIYSLQVRRRVDEIDASITQPLTEAENQVQNRETFYVFHLAIRVLSGILFTSLQYAVFFPSGFDFEFSCSLPRTGFTSKIPKNASASHLNSTSITCENSSASEKQLWWLVVSILNMGFALIILVEIIRLCRRLPNCQYTVGWSCDTEFIKIYLLGKRYIPVKLELTTVNVSLNLQECIDFYKDQVLEPSRTTDVIYGPKTGLDDLYIDVVIHTERAPHKFLKNMKRHEIFDVYMQVPQGSIRLKKVKDLFQPNKDTKNESPSKILVVGRPGIGKTVLTEKIMRDWANEVDEFYRHKIAFCFKFRWFNGNELNNITLKEFLRYGTELSAEKFEEIYQDIIMHPEKAILIFDGLDEFNGHVDCLDQLPPPNDPDICMSGISLFRKLIAGRFLPKATVLVTSRPTANEFYSRFTFDRAVEILGFSSDQIEEYVSTFCDNHERSDLKPKIWNHIKSSSDLSNLCYLPVNSFIVSTILFECFRDPGNDTGSLPITLTEFYQAAIAHFDKHHYRKLDGQSPEEAIKKLQLLAYDGIEPSQLVFNNELFDRQMKKSGLLNSLSNPYSQVQTQFCFIHLTVQEFFGAMHVTEMFTPEEIKEFIFCHMKSSKWYLVLQFIAGLLGKEKHYKDCVMAFAESFIIENSVLDLTDNCLLSVMKCLREVDDETIAIEACETTAMSDVASLTYRYKGIGKLYLHDWAAVTFVCKHMKQLTRLELDLSDSSEECYLEVIKLLKQRCIKQLFLMCPLNVVVEAEHLCKTLMESNCTLKHEHSKLTELNIERFRVTDESLSIMYQFFKNGHASCLEKFVLHECEISSRQVSMFCEVLDNNLCPELTYLDLSRNEILDEGVTVLCNGLIEQKQFKLTQLILFRCSLTDECIPSLCELLADKRCNLTILSLSRNEGIRDVGLRMLCESALTKEYCKLADLDLTYCSLTDKCIPELREALEDKHCVLNKLWLGENKFTNSGKRSLSKIETREHGKARGLEVLIW